MPDFSTTSTDATWPVLTTESILEMHRADTPSAPVPLWLSCGSILTLVLNVVLLIFYQHKNSEAQTRISAAEIVLKEEAGKAATLESQWNLARTEHQHLVELNQLVDEYAELKRTWHTPSTAREGTPERFMRQSSQNYARALSQGGRRARTLRWLFLPTVTAEIDGTGANGRRAVVTELLRKHQQYQEKEVQTIAINGTTALIVMRCKDGETSTYLKETLEYQGYSVMKCSIETMQEKPEIPDDFGIYSL